MAWRKRSLRDEMAAREDKALFNAEVGLYATKDLAAQGAFWAAAKASIKTVIEGINSLVVKATPEMFRLAGSTINQITGIGMDEDALEAVAERNPDRDQTVAIGAAFLPVVTRMFPIDKAVAGTANRLDRDFAKDNLNAYFGTNLLFQLRSLTISTVASFVPYFQLRHLEGLHQSINWAFGFGWLSWSVLSAIMDVTTTKPLKEYYNRQIKPNDYTHAQTVDAFTRGLITEQLMHQIMDNDGIRDDIRANLVEMHLQGLTVAQAHQAYLEGRIDAATWDDQLDNHSVRTTVRQVELDMAEKDYSGAMLVEEYQQGRITESEILQHLRWQGYREQRANFVLTTITKKREDDLQHEITQAARKLYRDCVIEEPELRTYLSADTFTAAEQDLVVEAELLQRRQRTFLSNADLAKSAALGLRSVPEITAQLMCRGYTQDDALTEVILRLASLLPSCEGKALKEAELVPILQALAQTLGATPVGISAAVLAFLQCFPIGGPLAAPVIVTFKATPEKVSFKGVALIEWEVTGADSVTITHIGSVESKGSTLYQFKEPVGFLLTATNVFGKRTEEVLVSILPDEEAPPPPVLTSFSPRQGPASGGTVVTLTGSGFTGATGVTFNYFAGTNFTVDSDTQITVTTPAVTADADVIVVGAAGVSAPLADQKFHFQPAAETVLITAITPNSGPHTGGTTVVITGSGFTGATAVNFGYTPGVGMQVDSDTQITVTTPPATGTVDVKIVTPSGQSATAQNRIFHFI